MNTPHPPSISWDEGMQRLFKSRPDFADAYLKNAAEGATDKVGIALFVEAVRRVAEFRGLAEVAEKAGMKPDTLARALSGRGKPAFNTLVSITQAIDMRLTVVPAAPRKPAPKKRTPAKKKPRRATA